MRRLIPEDVHRQQRQNFLVALVRRRTLRPSEAVKAIGRSKRVVWEQWAMKNMDLPIYEDNDGSIHLIPPDLRGSLMQKL